MFGSGRSNSMQPDMISLIYSSKILDFLAEGCSLNNRC